MFFSSIATSSQELDLDLTKILEPVTCDHFVGHDLALLTLTASVDISGDRTKPICLPTSKLYYPSKSVDVVVHHVDIVPEEYFNV